MKRAEQRKLIAHILRQVPQLADHGRMAIVEPRNRILRGVYLEDSSDPGQCYAWAFVQPLFEPPPFIVSFYLGRRLGGSTRTWAVADGAELAAIVSNDGPAFWAAASTPDGLATWSYASEKADPYVMRARALALIACRKWTEAAEALSRLCRQLGSTGWMAEMRKQCESLRVLVETKPDAAFDELRRWEDANTRQLRLSPE